MEYVIIAISYVVIFWFAYKWGISVGIRQGIQGTLFYARLKAKMREFPLIIEKQDDTFYAYEMVDGEKGKFLTQANNKDELFENLSKLGEGRQYLVEHEKAEEIGLL